MSLDKIGHSTFRIPENLNRSLDNLLAEIKRPKIDFVQSALGLMFKYLDYKEQGGVYFYQKPNDLSSRIGLDIPAYTNPEDSSKKYKLNAEFSKKIKDKLSEVAQRYGYSKSRVVIDSIQLLMQHIARIRGGYSMYQMKPNDISNMVPVMGMPPYF